MQKKNLQIETDFLDGEDDLEVEAIRQEKAEIVQFIQKKLSCILARNFIECWEQIKDCRFKPKRSHIRQQRFLTQDHIQKCHSKHKIKTQQISERVHSRNTSRENKYRVRTVHYIQSPDTDQRKYRAKSHKRHSEAGEERANVLEQIVQKLKASHQRSDISGDYGVEVLRKVSRLEKMMREIKNTNHSQKVVIREIETKQSRDTDQDETVRMFVDEIRDIRKQLAGIKSTNEQFIKAELEEINRSRVTERDNNFGHNQNEQNIGTNKTTNFNDQKTFIHGLSEIQKKEKLSSKNSPTLIPHYQNKASFIPNSTYEITKINHQPPNHLSNNYSSSQNYSNSYGLTNPNIRLGNFHHPNDHVHVSAPSTGPGIGSGHSASGHGPSPGYGSAPGFGSGPGNGLGSVPGTGPGFGFGFGSGSGPDSGLVSGRVPIYSAISGRTPIANSNSLNPSIQFKPSTFSYQTPSYNSNPYNSDGVKINNGGYQYNSGGNISTSTTFTSFPSGQGQFKPHYSNQFNHTRNPSIEKRQEEMNRPKPWQLSSYCSSCGRSCGCQRNFRPAGEQRYY